MPTTPAQVSETTLSYGTVTHTLVRLRADGADADRDPDFFPDWRGEGSTLPTRALHRDHRYMHIYDPIS